MHELAVTQRLLELALQHAERSQAARIIDLNIVIGELSSFVDDSVQFYWDIISEGTPAAGSRLHFRRIEMRMQCRDCQAEFRPDGESYRCPQCQGTSVKVVAGEEFYLESIEVEAAPAAQGALP